jgi:hypothetical protein
VSEKVTLRVVQCKYCGRKVKFGRDWYENLKGWLQVRVWNMHERKRQEALISGTPNDDYCVRTVFLCPKCAGPRVRDMRPKKRPEEIYRSDEMVPSPYADEAANE